jgi:hypothetical protein
MLEPKATIYSLLTTVCDTVYQVRPEVLSVFPCITFQISNNTPVYELEKEIGYQDIDTMIDIWDTTSSGTGKLLVDVQDMMLDEGYRLTFATDVPDPEGISHISTIFKLLV